MTPKKQPPLKLAPTPARPAVDLHAPPSGIGPLALQWWHQVRDEFAIVDLDGLLVLHNMVSSFDRAERAAAMIREQGEAVLGRDGQVRAHPLCAVERDARAATLAALKRLNIEIGEPPHVGRPAGPGR